MHEVPQEMPRKKLLDREIGMVSVQINQTRALLEALERQREWMQGVQRGLYPDPTPDQKQRQLFGGSGR